MLRGFRQVVQHFRFEDKFVAFPVLRAVIGRTPVRGASSAPASGRRRRVVLRGGVFVIAVDDALLGLAQSRRLARALAAVALVAAQSSSRIRAEGAAALRKSAATSAQVQRRRRQLQQLSRVPIYNMAREAGQREDGSLPRRRDRWLGSDFLLGCGRLLVRATSCRSRERSAEKRAQRAAGSLFDLRCLTLEASAPRWSHLSKNKIVDPRAKSQLSYNRANPVIPKP